MKNNNFGKIGLFLVLIVGFSSFLTINQPSIARSENNHFETYKNRDLQINSPISSDHRSDNIIFQQLPNADLVDNTDILNDFYNYLEDDSIIYDRPPSIISTYYIVSILESIDPDLLLTRSDNIGLFVRAIQSRNRDV